MTGIQDSAPPWRRLGLLALLALITSTVPVRAGAVTDHTDRTKPETESSTPASRSLSIDQRLLVPQDEFFLDMFIDRTPADGGYRVQRFYGYELFDPARERAV